MWGVGNLSEALLGDGGELEGLVALQLRDHHGVVGVVLDRHHATVVLGTGVPRA